MVAVAKSLARVLLTADTTASTQLGSNLTSDMIGSCSTILSITEFLSQNMNGMGSIKNVLTSLKVLSRKNYFAIDLVIVYLPNPKLMVASTPVGPLELQTNKLNLKHKKGEEPDGHIQKYSVT